jgi:photosystem II stability/assembly factor-like uncharacterized protein
MPRRSVAVLLGTHKGGFMLRSNAARERWKLEGPFFGGEDVHHLMLDTRPNPDGGHTMHAAVNSMWWGPGVRTSRDMGATWEEPEVGVKFAEGGDKTVARIWQITPGPESRPGLLYAGVDPGALFRSEDAGRTWSEVSALTEHPTRSQWNPGAGGLMVHSIVPHPTDPSRVHVGISAAGTFETTDGGETWEPRNKGVLADFMPEGQQFPEVGQCVHHLAAAPGNPELLYQQNHAGQYRSGNGGRDWIDISEGLPSRFGFPLLVHPHDDDTVYVIPEQGPEFRAPVGAQFAVYRSTDRGARWKKLTRGLPKDAYIKTYRQCLATDRMDDAGIYVGTSTGQLFASFDDGTSWELMWDMLPPIYSVEAAMV